MSSKQTHCRQAGVTLVELIVAIVIIGVSVGGVLSVFTSAVRNSADPLVTKQAFAIAEALLEEVALASFSTCDPSDPAAESGVCTPGFVPPAGARPFDHVTKYHGLALPVITGVDGVPLPGLGGYSAAITVVPPAAAWNGIPAADVRLIAVTVNAPNGVYTLDGYRTRYAPNAVP